LSDEGSRSRVDSGSKPVLLRQPRVAPTDESGRRLETASIRPEQGMCVPMLAAGANRID
jgi:hypothetical protein